MAIAQMSAAEERALILKARKGDESAFEALVGPHRRELHAHCYRMLGSLQDAEDALQDTLVSAWRGLDKYEPRGTHRAWLYKIATNTALTAIGKRKKRVLPLDYGPASADGEIGRPITETVWIEPYPDEQMGVEDGLFSPEASYEQRESLELAFVAALQHLPANQRAALILREVLGFSAKEVAETLQTSVPSINSALQRARKTIDDATPEQSQQTTLRALGDDQLRQMVAKYMDAMARADVDEVVSMLAEDAAWSMPPLASWFSGLVSIANFLRVGPLTGEFRWKHLATRANGQPASAAYTWHEQAGLYLPFAIDILTMRGDRIEQVTAFLCRPSEETDPSVIARWPNASPDERKVDSTFRAFGLPDFLPA